jgi:hypothetical protein
LVYSETGLRYCYVVQNDQRAGGRHLQRLFEVEATTFIRVIAVEIDVTVFRFARREEIRRALNVKVDHVAEAEA